MLQFLKYLFISVIVVFLLLIVLDLLSIFSTYSYFLGYFQYHFNINIWIIKIFSLCILFVFIFFIWPNIKEVFFNPLKPLSKKQIPSIIIISFLSFLFFITYLSDKDKKFDADGNSLTCVAWAIDHYEEVPCNWKSHPKYGTEVISVNKDIANLLALKKIKPNRNTIFFDPIKKEPKVFYSISSDSIIEFYNGKGINPHTGAELLPVTQEILEQYHNSKQSDGEWNTESSINTIKDKLKNY